MMLRLLIVGLIGITLGRTEPPASPTIPAAAQASTHFDIEAATNGWLATFPRNEKQKSDAYFEGGYWLMGCDLAWLSAVMILLLEARISARMRELAKRMIGRLALQSFLYWVQFCSVTALLMLPLTLYEGFFRERSYGLMNQTFAGWLRDQLLAFGVIGLVMGALAFMLLSTIVRKLPLSWPVWGVVAATSMLVFVSFIAPVFLAPLFNTYRPLQNRLLKDEILSLARGSDIAASDVFEENASKQSKRISAFVSGFGSTERITLNDNLLNRVSPQGVLSVMGHEMGHYVMHHIANSVLFSIITFGALFALLRYSMDQAVARFGRRWGIQSVSDVALLPFIVLVLSVFNFLFTPAGNTFTRTQEYEADLYGLNSVRQPDGEAEVDILLGEYRKLDPGPIEEFLFYDHPSGRTRVRAAMRWKAENLCLFDATLPCASQPANLTVSPTHPFRQSGTAHQ